MLHHFNHLTNLEKVRTPMGIYTQPICLEIGSKHGHLAPYHRADGITFQTDDEDQMFKLWFNLLAHAKEHAVKVRLWVPDYDQGKNEYSFEELAEVEAKLLEPKTHQLKLITDGFKGPKLVVTKVGSSGSQNTRLDWV
jgi:hypothetical protein